MTALTAERPSVSLEDHSPPPAKLTDRLLSLDVYRGVIMVCLISFGFGLRSLKDDPRWSFLARQVDHPQWTGVVFWDLIQPAFMFMVGVAMPFAFARRRAMGATRTQLFRHTLRRALGLIILGILITCITDGKISIEFRRVLQQIAVGYVISFFLLERGYLAQIIAAASILILYTLAWLIYSHRTATDPWAIGDANMGGAFERLVFRHNSTGHYVSLNAIPATATILYGVICGQLVGSALPKKRVMLYLAIFAATSIAAHVVVLEADFGDAPASYGTTLAANGARHLLAPGVFCHHSGLFNAAVEHLQRVVEHHIVIRRVEEYDTGALHCVGRCLQPAHDVSADDARAIFEAEYVQVLAQDSKPTGLMVHEGHARGAA